MDRLTARFINAALVYFVLGMASGVTLIFWPGWLGEMRTVHVHINLLGWLAMTIYAAGYSLVPRLCGRPLHSRRMAEAQFWLSNGALIGLSVFLFIAALQAPGTLAYAFYYALRAASAVLMLLSALLFVYNLSVTMRER